MKHDLLIKIKKALRILLLVVVAFALFFVILVIYFATRPDSVSSTRTGGMPAVSAEMPARLRSGFINAEKAISSITPVSILADNDGFNPALDASVNGIVEKKVTQNGYLSLVVGEVRGSINELSKVASGLGGRVDFVRYSNERDRSDKNAEVVFRVPSVNFGQAMTEAKAIAVDVTSENIETNDVTTQYIDMLAKMKNLKAVEAQYQVILQKAVKISDVLTITEQLSQVREQIDRLQGEMNYLSREVDMASISVYLTSEPEIGGVIWHPMSTIEKAIKGFLLVFYGLLDAVIFSILLLIPIFVLCAVIIGLLLWACAVAGKYVYKKIRKFIG